MPDPATVPWRRSRPLLAALWIAAAWSCVRPPIAGSAAPAPASRSRELATLLERALTAREVEALHRFCSESFRAAVPLAQFRGTLDTIARACGAPLDLEVDPPSWHPAPFQHLVRAAGPERTAVFRASFDAQGLVEGLVCQFEAPAWAAPRLDREMDGWAGDFGVAAARYGADRRCTAWFERSRGRDLFPLASIFKVYVLAEVARRLDAGELAWEQPVALRQEWKSLPSGTLHKEPAGSEFPLREYVRRMIAQSDNTAADHLLYLVGRESIEARLGEWRNSAPERNLPFLTTREMSLLKGIEASAAEYGGSLEALATAWRDAAPEGRRQILAAAARAWDGLGLEKARSAALVGYGLRTLDLPSHDAIEWHAAPRDVVRLYGDALAGRLHSPGASARFLEGLRYGEPIYFAPGVRWQGYKGGSDTGILTLSFVVEMDDGSAAAVCVCRAGLPAADTAVLQATVDAAAALARLVLEERLGD